MAAKPKPSEVENLKSLKPTQKPLPVYAHSADEDLERGLARTILRPSINGATTMTTVLRRDFGERGLAELADELADQCRAVTDGKMGRLESILTAQAHTLDAMFNDLTRLAYRNMGDHFPAADKLMRLALKAQSQARATVQAIGELKNPQPTILARQANVTSGPQQVNQSFDAGTRTQAHAGENQAVPSKLLEQTDGERLDPITASGTVAGDPPMAAVDAIHRAKVA